MLHDRIKFTFDHDPLLKNCSREPAVGGCHKVCDAYPVQRQTCGYLPSFGASPPFNRDQIILLGDKSQVCMSGLPRAAVLNSAVGESRTRDLSTTSPTLYH